MNKLKKGDIVGRKSYNKDIFFSIENIININGKDIAILKGLTVRILADAQIEDLELIEKDNVIKYIKNLENRLEDRINRNSCNTRETAQVLKNSLYGKKEKIKTGFILHLDGDKRYSEKSNRYYKKMGLNAIVRNIAENKQERVVESLIRKYNPDILIITGHDGMIKNGTAYNDIMNYRNSRYFINTVKNARSCVPYSNELIIFAGACQSFFEAIMAAGANFASSPARILIDFMDPLVIAEKVATTDEERYITINDVEGELRDGRRGVSGSGARGKRKRQSATQL